MTPRPSSDTRERVRPTAARATGGNVPRNSSEPRREAPRNQAFTLLEVMVAVAILGLALAAIFSSEAGAVKMAHRSRKMGIASLLARCKMGEIEQQVAEEGLPALFDSDSDQCCEGAAIDGFRCSWEINPIVLPENMFAPEEGEESPYEGPAPDDKSGGIGDLAAMDPSEMLSGGAEMGGIADMAMQYAFPILKPSFESQIRRATIVVEWKEGDVEHSFDVTKYLVSDQPIEMPAEGEEGEGAAAPEGQSAP